MSNAKERVFHAANLDAVNAAHPHMDDPRFISLTNQSNNCILRFTVFARCARELGEEDTRWAASPLTFSQVASVFLMAGASISTTEPSVLALSPSWRTAAEIRLQS